MRRQDHKTPLIWSAENGHTATCIELLEKGANVNATDKVVLAKKYKNQDETVERKSFHF
jgi:hypothetical protein